MRQFLNPPLVLAPMEDVSNLAFRLIAKRIGGPGLMFTEFVSAMAIHYGAAKTLKKMRIADGERPLGIQIFGADPQIMANTAKLCEDMGADSVDINMGCWVPKVCKTGSGAALLKDPETAEAIVKAVVKAVKVPVSVKVRAGWDYSHFAAPELCRRFEDAGAQMLTLHARFAKQGFDGEADWDMVKRLRETVRVPLVGNGDIKTGEQAVRMLKETGCDAVMVGRAAIGNPWALAGIRAALLNEPAPTEPSIQERIDTALEHLRLHIAFEADTDTFSEALASPNYAQAEMHACRHLRGQLPLYIKHLPGAAQVRKAMTTCSTYNEYRDLLLGFLDSVSEAVTP